MRHGIVTNATEWRDRRLQGKCSFQGLPISIENERGSYRQGVDSDGGVWRTFMHLPYGYIRLTEGVDGDHVDCYIGPDRFSDRVFVVHQQNPDTRVYDEDKIMLGFSRGADAKAAYLRQYDRAGFFQSMDAYDMATFRGMLKERRGLALKKSIDLEKAKKMSINATSTRGGETYRKVAEGKWVRVPKGTARVAKEKSAGILDKVKRALKQVSSYDFTKDMTRGGDAFEQAQYAELKKEFPDLSVTYKRFIQISRRSDIQTGMDLWEALSDEVEKKMVKSIDLEKAKEASLGTKSTHGGKKVVKTAQGWVPDSEGKGAKPPEKDPEDVRGSAEGYGTHNIETGDQVSFKGTDGDTVTGRVAATSGKSATVITEDGKQFSVPWGSVTDFKGTGGTKSEVDPGADLGSIPIPPEDFVANEWAAPFDDPDVSVESILADVEKTNPDIRKAVSDAEERLRGIEQTISRHRVSGEGEAAVYSPERQKKHQAIIDHFMSPEKIKNAKPPKGQSPTLVMLGGRGGSGKSWFKGQVYDEDKAIVLDADEIKGMLDEYEGWNAFQVHEESSDILEGIKSMARASGLNVVIDATLKTTKSAIENAEQFVDAGYDLEVHYMHAPRKIAAQRAMSRFTGKSGRYVPIGVILGNTKNEESFEAIKKQAKAWSFRDSSGGPPPKLVSELGKGRFMKALFDLISMMKSSKGTEKDKDWAYDFYDFRTPVAESDYSDFTKKNIERCKKLAGDDEEVVEEKTEKSTDYTTSLAKAIGTKHIRKFWKNGRWNYVYPKNGATRRPRAVPEHKVLKNLGGTTGGALLIELPNGERKVMKYSTGAGHLKDEYMANRVYEILGVPVPSVQLREGPKGPAQIADFVEGTLMGDLSLDERQQAIESLKQGFVADALLGNWDVLGMDGDNIIWDGSKAWRIDNGGALRYRAQGEPKGEKFSSMVGELKTMRNPDRGAGKRAYSTIGEDDIRAQVRTVISKKQSILEAIDDLSLRRTMDARIENLRGYVESRKSIMRPLDLMKHLRGRLRK